MHCLTTILRKQIVAMFLSLFLVSGGSVWAQFDGQYSQYMNNLCLIKPSYSGRQPMIQASLFERLQWIGMPGAPVISILSVLTRSEERRVGKECRSRWSPYH